MEIWQGIILGIVEGLTEFLPVSSTGHLILANELLNVSTTDFTKSFEIIIQLGAILAVIVLYWKKLWNITMIKKLALAFIPTGIVGLVFYKYIKTYLLGNASLVVWTLIIGGIALILFELWNKNRAVVQTEVHEITYRQAFVIGLCQILSVVPGVSRSAATIIGGLMHGITRTTVVEFSFLLAIPTMLAASGYDMLKNASSFTSDQFGVLGISFIVSFIVAMAAIKFLLAYVRRYSLISFGIYRILVALFFIFIVL